VFYAVNDHPSKSFLMEFAWVLLNGDKSHCKAKTIFGNLTTKNTVLEFFISKLGKRKKA